MGAAIIGGTAGQGALTGMSNASNQMSNAAMGMAGAAGAMGAAKMGALGGGGSGGGLTSGQIGTFTSGSATSMSNVGSQPMAFGGAPAVQQAGMNLGNNPIQPTPLSFGEKFKAYGKAGLYGAGSGMAAGAVQSAGHMMHADKIVRPIVNDIQGVGNIKTIEIGQVATAYHSLKDIDRSMISLDENHSLADFKRGHEIINSPEAQQEYLGVMRNNVDYYEHMKPEIQNQIDQRIFEELNKHPASAGKMMDEVRGLQERKQGTF